MKTLNSAVINPKTTSVLLKISKQKDFKQFYLAGGTALALQLMHRKSIDLDFFSSTEFSNNILHAFPESYKVINNFNNSIEIISLDTKIMFFYFGFPLKYPVREILNVKLADARDIGMMKLLALQGRTTKKDIYDLYFIDQEVIPLEKLLVIFEKFYPKDKFNQYSSFKMLLDENELTAEPDPILLKQVKWEHAFELVKSKLQNHLRKQIEF